MKMSEKFNGFSQDEINKVSGVKYHIKAPGTNQNSNTLKQAFRGSHSGIRRMPDKWSKAGECHKKQQKASNPSQMRVHQMESVGAVPATSATSVASNNVKEIASSDAAHQNDAESTLADVKLDKSLSTSIEEALFYQPLRPTERPTTNGHVDKAINSGEPCTDTDDSVILPTPVKNVNSESPFKGISLKDFEAHRKMIEEQNKQKKELLQKAIEQYSQKTAAEARKIEEIRSELAKLDNDLAVDVAILRKQIDNACINFANIEKQYMKIEQQFLKAKIDLHNAAEKKDLLTEHLCTVIAHNEDRKAQKLSELMEKVGLGPTGDYVPNVLKTDK